MTNLIVEHWNNKECSLPGINCIAYPDGKVIILNCYSMYDPNTKEKQLFCEPLCDTTIESIEKYGSVYWVRVGEWASINYKGGKIYGGDGTMGNEGFIACVDEADNLLWAIFFENTNPIKSLKIRDRKLIAVNEHSELKVEINLDVLTQMKMTTMTNSY